ncbi:MAG: hypothetical protein P1S46_04955 [bacterium]|nr:hypothetical protein [bacterium]
MAHRGQKHERIIYEEKPLCGRCGADIVGVIPRWRNEKPLCRECTFELEQLAAKPRVRGISVEEKEPLTPEEKQRRAVLFGVLAVALLALGLRTWYIAPLLKSPQPLRHGTFETDAGTDRCIEELWKISRQLQDKKLSSPMPLCPLSGKPYEVIEVENDTIVNCPNPGEHSLTRLGVSRKKPIPLALAGSRP